MTIRKAGRGAIAGVLALVMLMTAPVQSLADEVSESYAAQAEEGVYGVDLFAYALIKPGDSGEKVKSVQRRLTDLGYFSNSITGNYGSITKEAVRSFQIMCGLSADGIVGEETYKRLFADDAPLSGARPVATPEPTATFIPFDTIMPVVPSVSDSGSIPDFVGVLKNGSRGSAVKSAQRRLKALGYLTGSADGAFGSGTAAAVKAFQIKCGIAADGTITFETHIRLYADDAPNAGTAVVPVPTQALTAAPTQAPTVAPTQAPTARPTAATPYPGLLRYGSKGAAVKALQVRLTELGYLTGSIDGAFGNATRTAVRAFQGARGLSVTGEVNEATHNALYSAGGNAPGGSTFVELKIGMTGDAVKTLQQRLRELGYYNGSLQGTFGELTQSALRDFQAAAGLARSGALDRATYELIYSSKAPYKNYDENDYTRLSQGDRGEDVKRLQSRLIVLGYLSGTADGIYGSGTATAVRAFQTANSLSATGIATVETQQRLYADGAIGLGATATPAPLPTSTPNVAIYPTLQTGSTGATVKALQKRLIELGYLNDTADGAYGGKTAAAVRAFQIKAGLSVNGIADSLTQTALYRADAPKPGDAATPQPTAGATAAPTANAYVTLTSGSTGAAVKALQERLKQLGYYTAAINSTYDSNTLSAVKSFQKANSLSVDGAAGVQTQAKLFSDDAISRAEAGELAEVESNTPVSVPGSVKKPVISDIVSMDWFENVNGFFNRSSGVFKVGSTAIVTDVKTGICYTVRRMGGSNHADVEPLTAFDAWQMYRIYNKNWSWTRRAVVVTVGGKNIAASINGMPHGGESISDNNFVGHSCIHFTNSRTHGTNRVDPDHQAAVAAALATDVAALNAKIQNQ